MRIIERLIRFRRFRIAKELLALYCVEIPAEVEIGADFELIHRGFGTVIHPLTKIGDRVKIYHQVTIGRADGYPPYSTPTLERIIIEDDVVLFPGCKVLGKKGVLRVGRGTIVAANAVLTKSTGEGEIWAGVPAKRISLRQDFPFAELGNTRD